MNSQQPKIASLNPVVFPDKRRVMMELVVEDLPNHSANVALNIPGETEPDLSLAEQAAGSPSPYPNIELAIIDSRGKTVATTFIVEHQEPFTNLTLHLREPEPQEQYIARAEMIYQEAILEVVEVPFTLAEAA